MEASNVWGDVAFLQYKKAKNAEQKRAILRGTDIPTQVKLENAIFAKVM
jgi:hypothetical protein